MNFHYSAIGSDGTRIAGNLEAGSLADLEIRLQRMQLELIRARPLRPSLWRQPGGLPRRELINFCFQLEQLLISGVPLLDGLADLRDSAELPRLRDITASLIERIESGETLSAAMASQSAAFKPVFVALIRAGEESGQLPTVLERLSESLKWEDELAAQTRKLLLYPSFVALTVGSVSAFLLIFMVPQLKTFVSNMGQKLPLHSELLFALSDFLVTHGPWILLPAAGTLVAAYLHQRRHEAGRLRLARWQLRLPLLGTILRKIMLARLAGTFAMLYAAGIPVIDGIRITRKVVGNRQIEQALEHAEAHLIEGKTLAMAFAETGLFPPFVLRMLRTGEQTGGLDRALNNLAYFYTRDVRESVEKVQAMIEPALTVIMGLLLGWIMLSVIGPIYDIISKVKA
jgi:type IV pilus assembly protein PilC